MYCFSTYYRTNGCLKIINGKVYVIYSYRECTCYYVASEWIDAVIAFSYLAPFIPQGIMSRESPVYNQGVPLNAMFPANEGVYSPQSHQNRVPVVVVA